MKADYANGKIYLIKSNQTKNVYIGSTTLTLSKRLIKHKADYVSYKNGKFNHHVSSFDILKFDDAWIELLELFPCTNRTELEKREGVVIKATSEAINKRVAGRDSKQYRIDKCQEIKNKKGAKCHCICGKSYTHDHKLRHTRSKRHQNFLLTNKAKDEILTLNSKE